MTTEETILDRELTAAMRARQRDYIRSSVPVDAADVLKWSRRRHIWNNTVAMMGPVL